MLPGLGSAVQGALRKDDVIVTAQVGEFMMQRDAVDRVGSNKLAQVNAGADPAEVFGGGGGGQGVVVNINAPSTGIPIVDAITQFVTNAMAVSIQTPGSAVRQANARGTLPGVKPVRGRS